MGTPNAFQTDQQFLSKGAEAAEGTIRVPSARCCCVQSVSTEKPRHPRHAQAGGRHEVTEGKKGCTEAAPWFASKLGANLSLLLNKSVFPMFA